MDDVALDLDEDAADTMYGYQVLKAEDGEGFRIWKETGVLRGEYLKPEDAPGFPSDYSFETFVDALSFLLQYILDGEV